MSKRKYSLLLLVIFTLPSIGFSQMQVEANQSHPAPQGTKLNILYKPKAGYPVLENSTICVSGAVILRAQFLNTSEIGKISVVKGLPYRLTQKSIEAARMIKFEPATKNGKTITVFKQIEYSFGIF